MIEIHVPEGTPVYGIDLQIGEYYYEFNATGGLLYGSKPPEKLMQSMVKLIVIDKDYFKYYDKYTEENFNKFKQLKEAKEMLGVK